MQPVELVGKVIRFKQNKVVRDMLDFCTPLGFDLNKIVGSGEYSQDDMEQFYQLIGYSISGFHELNMVSDETAQKASILAKMINPKAGGCRDTGCEIHIGVEKA